MIDYNKGFLLKAQKGGITNATESYSVTVTGIGLNKLKQYDVPIIKRVSDKGFFSIERPLNFSKANKNSIDRDSVNYKRAKQESNVKAQFLKNGKVKAYYFGSGRGRSFDSVEKFYDFTQKVFDSEIKNLQSNTSDLRKGIVDTLTADRIAGIYRNNTSIGASDKETSRLITNFIQDNEIRVAGMEDALGSFNRVMSYRYPDKFPMKSVESTSTRGIGSTVVDETPE